MSEPRVDPVRKYLGAFVMAVGVLIAALCGTCTAALAAGSLYGVISNPTEIGPAAGGMLGALIIYGVVGGLPTLLGVHLARRGWRAMRPDPRVNRSQLATFSDPEPPT